MVNKGRIERGSQKPRRRLLKYAQGTETIASVFGVLSGEMTPVNPPLYQAHRGAYERARSASVVRRSTLWKPGRLNEKR